MINIVKSLIPPQWKFKIKSKIDYWLDTISTEYNFRFQWQKIQEDLNIIRKIPRNLHIEGTNICNAKCTFCAYPQMERSKATMPMEDFQRIVDEYVAMGGKYISLTPIVGDPFIDRHLFERLNDLNKRAEIKGFYFYTNSILMKPQISEKLLAYGEKLNIYVSWGGFDRETYKSIMGVDRFDIVRQNIEAFVEAKLESNSSTILTIALRCPLEKCTGELWEKFCQWRSQKIIKIDYITAYDSWAGKVKDEDLKQVGLKPVVKPYKRGACELLYMKPIILANGKVNACACRDVEAELIVGDLKESTLSKIWAGQAIEEIIQRHERGDFPDVCQRCTWYISIYNLRKRNARISQTVQDWSQD
ncbi:radical SAM protein [Calothrix membranacea FACHB-236]|nr:radical SAM protein [Calothrix membranacea FACHB-236]